MKQEPLPPKEMPDTERDAVDVLADEFASRFRRGEIPSVTEYVKRYPQYESQIRELFPSVALLEQLSFHRESEAAEAESRRQESLPPHYHLGDFEILQEIGRGGMGIVYEAVQHSLHRTVALKVVSTSAIHSRNQLSRFQREARAAAQLHHTNIVPVFGVGVQDGLSYYVMQRIHGLGLDQVLAELVRIARKQPPSESGEKVTSSSNISARDLADVLVSSELSQTALRSATTVGAGSDSSVLRSGGGLPPETNSQTGKPFTATGLQAVACEPTRQPAPDQDGALFARSSLVLRDEVPRDAPPGKRVREVESAGAGGAIGEQGRPSVRSSLVLREERLAAPEFASHDSEADGLATTVEMPPVAETLHLEHLTRRYWRNVARIGVQVAAGLSYAHSQGTLHRDIKPANVLLDTDGIAWIADFGLAKISASDTVTQTGDVVGTLRYMAPEQFRGTTDQRSDVYSLGLTLYELLCLRPAYDDTNRERLIARKLTPHDPTPPRKFVPHVPRDLETIVLKSIAYEPNSRYQTAGELLGDLDAFLEDRPISARRVSSVEKLWRWCRRNPMVASLSGTVALLLLVTSVLAGTGYVHEKRQGRRESQLREAAVQEKNKADAERQRSEQLADVAFEALDMIGQSFVRASFGDTLSVEEGEGDEAYTVPAISPETAATLERIRLAYDQLSTVAGADERYRQEAAKADLRIGEVHLRLDRYAEARQAFERAIGLFEQSKSTGSQDQPQTRLQLAELYNGLGEAARGLNDREFSRQQHERAVQLLETNPGLPEIRFELARTHYLMGKRSFSLGGFPGFSPGGRRRPTGGSPTEGRSEMAAAPTDPRPPRDGERLGEESRSGGGRRGGPGPGGERSSGRPGPGRSSENEREHLQTAVDLLNGLVSEFPDVAKYHFLMAQCHLEFTHGFRENRELAAGHRLAAIDILETLIQMMPDNPDYLHQLGVAYERRYVEWNPLIWIPRSLQPLLLDASAESSDRDGTSLPSAADVEQDMLLSVMYSGELIRKQPRVPASMMSHILGLSRLADVQAYQHKDIQAEQSLREALRLLDEAVTRFPEQALLGAIRRNRIELFLGKLLVDRQEYAEARDLLEPLVERIDLTAGSSSPGTPPAPHDARFMAYHLLASVLENLGETEAAERNASRADRARSEWRDMIRGFSRPR